MHSSLIRAWRNCAPDFRVMLQLIHVERLKQRDVAKVWGWSESKVSRALDAAMSQIREDTLRGISDFDLGEVLVWQDFIDLGNLCREFLE
jgi:DNA-directed RNA polymerase specialized sigma24 family protein